MLKNLKTITINGICLKDYYPVNYLKGKPHLFNVEKVTFVEMLYLAMLDKNGRVISQIPFSRGFLKLLFKCHAHFVAFRKQKETETEYVLVLKSFIEEQPALKISELDPVQYN